MTALISIYTSAFSVFAQTLYREWSMWRSSNHGDCSSCPSYYRRQS